MSSPALTFDVDVAVVVGCSESRGAFEIVNIRQREPTAATVERSERRVPVTWAT